MKINENLTKFHNFIMLVLPTFFNVRDIIATSRKGCVFSHQNTKDEVAVGPIKEDVTMSTSASI